MPKRKRKCTNKVTAETSTTFMERFRKALSIMCGVKSLPPLDLCKEYLRKGGESYYLQQWVFDKKTLPLWAQGITTIEAAQRWADEPAVWYGHRPKPEVSYCHGCGAETTEWMFPGGGQVSNLDGWVDYCDVCFLPFRERRRSTRAGKLSP